MRDYTRDDATFDLRGELTRDPAWPPPIRDSSGSIVAGVSLSATRPYMPKDRMHALVPVMKAASKEISVKLEYQQE